MILMWSWSTSNTFLRLLRSKALQLQPTRLGFLNRRCRNKSGPWKESWIATVPQVTWRPEIDVRWNLSPATRETGRSINRRCEAGTEQPWARLGRKFAHWRRSKHESIIHGSLAFDAVKVWPVLHMALFLVTFEYQGSEFFMHNSINILTRFNISLHS